MKLLQVYVDASVIGGCVDDEFALFSRKLWDKFIKGEMIQVLSEHTLRELQGAPEKVRVLLLEIPSQYQFVLPDSPDADALADEYLKHGVVGPGSRADALHIALATIGKVDVLVSWNFKHIVNLGRIRMFNAVNLQQGYGLMEIRSPREVLCDEKDI
ncbi:MAG: PIN domain protein [Candidatus Wallbacteria bacterium]|nr:PIN domain protein [Candidatus Wallbacteria bacterium]